VQGGSRVAQSVVELLPALRSCDAATSYSSTPLHLNCAFAIRFSVLMFVVDLFN
jgi:hypothetical protein